MKSCKTCKWLVVPRDAAGRRYVKQLGAYRCFFPVVAQPLPDSVTKAYGYRAPSPTQYMAPSDGAACPTYEKLVKEKA